MHNKLTNCMELSSSWEANSHSAIQKTSRLLGNPKVHYLHKIPPLVHILRQINPLHTFTSSFSKIHFNIILPSTSRSLKRSLLFRLSEQYFLCISHLPHACYIPRPSYRPWFDLPNNLSDVIALLHNSLCYTLLHLSFAFAELSPLSYSRRWYATVIHSYQLLRA